MEDLGSIAPSDFFAGTVLAKALDGGRLWRCRSCESMFRYPILPAGHYLSLYAAGEAEQWSVKADRNDLRIIRSIITAQTEVGRVLDLGCGSGDFLLSLGANLAKCGVEPSTAAAALAAGRGISILAPTMDQLPADAVFDLITLIDVVEHVPRPQELLDQALAHLRPGGIIVIATGDPKAAVWHRLFRSRFWYPSFPEHLTFPSVTFLQTWSSRHGAKLLEWRRVRYQNNGIWKMLFDLCAQCAYLLSPSGFSAVGRWLPQPGRARTRRTFGPGIPGLFVDHQVVAIQKAR